jgi:hypothetical protein
MENWSHLEKALVDQVPKDKILKMVEKYFFYAASMYDEAERQMFDIFDVFTSNLLVADLPKKEHRARILKRADYHERTAANLDGVRDKLHAEMHRRLAQQLRDIASK